MIPISTIQIEAELFVPSEVKKSTALSPSLSINTLISLGFVVDTLSIITEGQLSSTGFDPLSFALGGYGSREMFGPEPPIVVEKNTIRVSEILIDIDQIDQYMISRRSVKTYQSEIISLPNLPTPLSKKKTRVSTVVVEV